MKKYMFTSASGLNLWLAEHTTFTFTSKIRRLTRTDILLHALAGRDFNPAHIVEGYADKSLFKGIVSHGIGIISRAEGMFVKMMVFENPAEIIAAGFKEIKYYKPLRLNASYYYEYTISNMRPIKNRLDFDCHISCIAFDEGKKATIAEWDWKPSFVEPTKLSRAERRQLIPVSYALNVFRYFVFEPLGACLMYGIGIPLILSIIPIMILQMLGVIPSSSIDYMI